MNQINNVFIVIFALILLGYLLKKFDFLSEKDGKVLSKFLMHTTFPALILLTTARVSLEPSLFLLPIMAFFFGAISLLIGWFIFKKYPNAERGLLTMATAGLNTGLFGYPIIEGIWGAEGVKYVVIFDIGNTFVTFGLIYSIGNYFSSENTSTVTLKSIFTKVLKLPALQALLIGLLINSLGVQLPALAVDFLDVLAKGNKPIVLLLLGLYLNFSIDKTKILNFLKVLGVRYACGLTAAILFYFLVQSSDFQNIMMICFIMPIPISFLPFSNELGYDTSDAGTLTNLTLVVSFALIWVLLLNI